MVMVSCDLLAGGKDDEVVDEGKNDVTVPAVYNGFYNYPIGRVDPTGTLTVENKAAAKVLLFNGTVEGNNFLGIVDSLSSVTLKLPEEKFYSIVAVDASNYEEKATQAAQKSEFTYYSNTQAYNISVTTSGSTGTGKMLINNSTSYWVTLKSSDLSQNYAVVAPNALRVSVPIEINTNYDFQVFFTKEVTFNGRVVASVDTTDVGLYDTAVAKESNNYQFKVDIGSGKFNPSNMLKPSILVRNNLDRGSVYVNKSTIQLTNGANAVDGGLAVIAGESQLYVGLEAGNNINTINFENMAWTAGGHGNLFVNEDIEMENGKLYIITLSGSDASTRSATVEIVDAAIYFEQNK